MDKRIDFSRTRILVVENNSLTRRLLRDVLRGFGIEHIREARDVPEAFALIYSEPFDAVILDFFLGDMDGADFVHRIRHDAACRNRRVPILLVTAQPEHHKVLKVRDAGANGMLAKPIVPKTLYDRLYDMIARPRPFIVSRSYIGPDRSPARRRRAEPGALGQPAASAAPRPPRPRTAIGTDEDIFDLTTEARGAREAPAPPPQAARA